MVSARNSSTSIRKAVDLVAPAHSAEDQIARGVANKNRRPDHQQDQRVQSAPAAVTRNSIFQFHQRHGKRHRRPIGKRIAGWDNLNCDEPKLTPRFPTGPPTPRTPDTGSNPP